MTLYAPYRGTHPSSITRVVYRACGRAGLPPMGGHRLRHALASEMLRQGSDLVEISQVLRHRDLATTSVYAITRQRRFHEHCPEQGTGSGVHRAGV